MNHRSWLTLTEYGGLGVSVAGTVLSVFTQQIAWATTPLILTLGLNLINRQRERQQFQDFAERKEVMEDLNTRRLNQLDMVMADFQSFAQATRTVNLEALEQRLQVLEKSIQRSPGEENTVLPTFEENQAEEFNHLLAEIKETLERINRSAS
ncbi:MAG: hypothetical protein ACKN9E_15335 [Microcystaceae cyanobacterium]